MYITPYWCGVISVLLAEAVACVLIIISATKMNKDEEVETDEEQEKGDTADDYYRF